MHRLFFVVLVLRKAFAAWGMARPPTRGAWRQWCSYEDSGVQTAPRSQV